VVGGRGRGGQEEESWQNVIHGGGGLGGTSEVAGLLRCGLWLGGTSAKTYLASGTPLLREDTRYSNFTPFTLGAPRAGLPPSLAPGESGGTLAIQPYPGRYWLHNLTPHAS